MAEDAGLCSYGVVGGYKLWVWLTDAEGQPVCNATVTVSNACHSEVLWSEAGEPNCTKIGLRDWSGHFELSVDAPGFAPYTADLLVSDGTSPACAPDSPVELRVTLSSVSAD